MSIREHQEGSRVATKVAQLLTYAGTLPFIFAAAYPTALVNGAKIITVSNSYAVAIISFVSGIHWALYMLGGTSKKVIFLILSNITALAALAFFIFSTPKVACAGYMALFLSLLALDSYNFKTARINLEFYRLRRNATLIVLLALAALLFRQ